jgi:hypothetical protein
MVKRLATFLCLSCFAFQALASITVTITWTACIDSYSITFFGTGNGATQSPAVSSFNSPAGQTSGTVLLTYPYSATFPTSNFHFQSHGATCNFDFVQLPAGTPDGTSYSMICNGGSCGFPTITNTSSPTFTNYVMSVTNNLPNAAQVTWRQNGSIVKQEVLQPGQSDNYNFTGLRNDSLAPAWNVSSSISTAIPVLGVNPDGTLNFNPLTYGDSYGSGAGGLPPTNGYSGSGSGNIGSGGNVGVSASPPVITGNTNQMTFGTPSGSATETTLEKFANQNHVDLGLLQSGQAILHQDGGYILSAITNGNGSIITLLASNVNVDGQWLPRIYAAITNNAPTNAVANITYTNNFVFTNSSGSNVFVLNQPNYTNLLSMIETNTRPNTNSITTNGEARMWSLIPATATNASAALAAAAAADGDYGVQGVIDSLTPTLPGPPSTPDMTITFAGHVYDLDPNHLVPNASTVSLTGWTIILLLSFLLEIARLFFKTVTARATTQTGRVPDAEVSGSVGAFGFEGEVGGNFIGWIIFLVLPLVFIGVFAAVMSYLFSHLGITVADAMNISGWTSSMGGLAYYLLASFFPVSLFFSLVITRITLIFTMGKLLALASAASRWIPG